MNAGEQLMLLLGAANRDPAAFAEPDAFDVDRLPRTNVAFGLGIHFCLGAPLAKLQAEVAIGALLGRFDNLRLARPATAYRWRESALLRQLEAVPLRL